MTALSVYRQPREVVELYLYGLYNQHRIDLVQEIIAAETWRHTPGGLIKLTLEESITRLGAFLDRFPKIEFENTAYVVDGEMVTSIWNGKLQDQDANDIDLAGIEVFRVVQGKIVEVWNQEPGYTLGLWHPKRTFLPS